MTTKPSRHISLQANLEVLVKSSRFAADAELAASRNPATLLFEERHD